MPVPAAAASFPLPLTGATGAPALTITDDGKDRQMRELKFLAGYPDQVTSQVGQLITDDRLGSLLLKKYPAPHGIRTDKALYGFAVGIKDRFLRTSEPLGKVAYDGKINVIRQALGLHTYVSRVQGARLKASHEIRIAAVFKDAPLEFLRMIVVHELAHLREKEHDKAFYRLCTHMEPAYHQLEFDLRLYLTHLELSGPLYHT
jgi:predicted metal-dependent hydrolase